MLSMKILIVSENGDSITERIIDWLLHYNSEVIHISDSESKILYDMQLISDENSSTILVVDGEEVYIEEIGSYFWRRGFINYSFENFNFTMVKTSNVSFDMEVSKHLSREKEVLIKNIYFQLENIENRLGSYLNFEENKIDVLNKAKCVGLKIPSTIITTNKKRLIEFKKINGDIISKPMHSSFTYKESDVKSYSHLTIEVNEDDIDEQNDIFFPALFQEKIRKKYELRIFFLKGVCYSMAIFSQQDEQTKIDFRNYNKVKPNRMVPYILPTDIELKICKLMNYLELDNGSIDMIVTYDNNYVFLEVNPVGQFGMVSYPCNYYIEKKIAQMLMSN